MPTIARKYHTPDSVGGMCGSPLTFSLYSQTLRACSCAYARRAPYDATHERVSAQILIRQADPDATTSRGLVTDVHNAIARGGDIAVFTLKT